MLFVKNLLLTLLASSDQWLDLISNGRVYYHRLINQIYQKIYINWLPLVMFFSKYHEPYGWKDSHSENMHESMIDYVTSWVGGGRGGDRHQLVVTSRQALLPLAFWARDLGEKVITCRQAVSCILG